MYNKIILFFASSILFIGCSNEAPNCSDSDTTDLVIEIANKELVKSLGEEKTKSIKLSVETIRTKKVNKEVGSFECAADLKIEGPNGSNSLPITYTSELTDDGDSFYVNVFGL